MRRHSHFIATAVLLAATSFGAVTATAQVEVPPMQQEAVATPWQEVITSQIQAFRDGDALTAFSHAGAGFQQTFDSAEGFFVAIIGSGYAPIMESRSHSFGVFERFGEGGVVQEVRLVGKDQELYTAVYQLTLEEEANWRVQGVQLVREAGIAI